ncbi:SGNH/GDSL hydrolase family protein [Lactococcus lactis]|uniref:SGNH/GDSL hydrolase family protein n=1 Tax=Lactococcus lactis TaxID=1358 RepID=UPI0025A06A59|nr:SGNH/GDSL hydrolase family protein [Lactococcus lactis]MDM7655962.1 SGNH/GDSL hydrolase family protein [Lactococcus lactis]
MSDYSVTLSTTEPNNYVGLIKLRQGDVASQSIQATITANGQLFNFDRLAVFFNAVLPNGYVVRDKVTNVDYANSKLNYVVADSFLQEVAQVTAWFSFENDEKIIDSTKNFQYSVIGGWKECIPQGNYIYELSEIQREIEQIIGDKDFSKLLLKIDSIKTEYNYINQVKADKTELNKTNEEIWKLEATTSTLDNKVSTLSSGAPKAVSQVSSMTDKTKNYVYTGTESGYTPGNWYYWNGSMWKSGGTYQAAGIGDKTVTTSKLVDSSVIPSKTNFISKNSRNINLFDKNSQDNWFGKVVSETGSIAVYSGWNYSHSIPCKPGDVFIVGTTSEQSGGYAGLFNGEQWISNVINTSGYWKVPTNVAVTSIRFAISVSIFESAMIVLMPNEIPKAYIPFNFLLDDQIKLDYANLENVSVEENDVTFLSLSKNQGSNKFDLNNTSPYIIYENNTYAPLDGYVSTNDIPVKNGDVVNWNFSGYGWALDSQKNPIEFMPKSSYTISNVNASFVRIAIPTGDIAKGMVTINEPIPTSYQPFRSFYELADNITINESNFIKSQTNETQNPISGKTVSIVGDSYSAFKGWVPEGNSFGYDGTYNGVTSVSNMWWFKVIQKFNMSLMLNESWSGSTICNTGYSASDATATSFLTRITKRYGATNTLGQKPQVLFILGGLNDSWAGSPLGNVKYSDWTTDDLKTTLGAYSKMINDILLYNPGIEIINFEYADVSQAIRDGKALICEHFGVKNVPISVVDSLSGHPTTTGMQQIADQIITALNV